MSSHPHNTNFYPRSPCGERPHPITILVRVVEISIHALLAESDPLVVTAFPGSADISIHALLAESDRALRQLQSALRHFYPRSPCGERRLRFYGTARHTYFYPRSPCGERLNGIRLIVHIGGFLSTLSLRRATMSKRLIELWKLNFYPRSPCGERRILVFCGPQGSGNFYPRSPCGERPEAIKPS